MASATIKHPPKGNWKYKPPFPAFGGKSRVAHEVWRRFGQVKNYIEPFANSAAVLFLRPEPITGTETINDKDGLICNFWRALRDDPDQVAHYCDQPVFENNLHAIHAWLVGRKDSLQDRLEGDPDFYDPKIAGWWVWGICCWIGSGFCSGKGPWRVVEQDGVRQLVHLANAGMGVHRKRVHLTGAGMGVHRQRELCNYLADLAKRLRQVRVCCGDWQRVCTPAVLFGDARRGPTAVFLDPPYSAEANRDPNLYRQEDLTVAYAVREWAIAHGEDPRLRICLAGYDEHTMPADWTCHHWKATGGYGNQGKGRGRINCHRETLWFSPHCLAGIPNVAPLLYSSEL